MWRTSHQLHLRHKRQHKYQNSNSTWYKQHICTRTRNVIEYYSALNLECDWILFRTESFVSGADFPCSRWPNYTQWHQAQTELSDPRPGEHAAKVSHIQILKISCRDLARHDDHYTCSKCPPTWSKQMFENEDWVESAWQCTMLA